MAVFLEDVEIIGRSLIIKDSRFELPSSDVIDVLASIKEGTTRIRLGTDDDSVTIFDSEGHQAFRLNSRNAILDVGGPFGDVPGDFTGIEGDIRVYDGAGRIRVHIDGQDGAMKFLRHTPSSPHTFTTATTLAVEFDIHRESMLDPGTVMVMRDDGELEDCREFEDRRVVGVLLHERPHGIVLDHRPSLDGRRSVAVAGKTFCKFDPAFGEVEPGSLLTTTSNRGHAGKSNRVPGTIVGKALGFPTEDGLIEILVSLQ
jgi:hypothetical protein